MREEIVVTHTQVHHLHTVMQLLHYYVRTQVQFLKLCSALN